MQQHTYKHIEAFSGKSWNKYKHRCNTRRQTHTDFYTKLKLQTFISRQQKKNWPCRGVRRGLIIREKLFSNYAGGIQRKAKQRAEMCVLAWDFFLNQLPFGDMVKGSDKWM